MNGRFNWGVFYTHAENRLAVDLINNQNLQHMYAAQDSVLLPNGTIACYAATPAAYANCVPINPFGPMAVSWDAFHNIFQTTDFHQTNTLDDFGGSISGKVAEAWAGPITAALSAVLRINANDVTTH